MKKVLGILFIIAAIFIVSPTMPAYAEAVDVTVSANEGWESATYDSATTVLTNTSEGYSFKLTKNDSNSTATLMPNGVQTATKIVIPSAVLYNNKTYQITAIKEYILGNPNTLTQEVIVSEGITALGSTSGGSGYAQTFRSATGLKNITLPSTLTFLSNNCFMGCTSLPGIDIPEGVTAIPTQAFSGCKALTSVTFHGNNITTLGNNCFSDCTSLAEISNFPDSVTSIGSSAFSKTAITEFVVPSGVTEIQNSTFSIAQKLKSIVFKGNIKTFGTNVFQYCYLNTITFEGDTAPTTLGSFGRYDGTGLTVFYPANSIGYDAPAFRAFFTKTTFEQVGMYNTAFINISPGSSASELNATWSYSVETTSAVLQIAPKVEGQTFPTEGVQSFTATQEDTGAGYFSNKATITGLSPNTEYVYRVGDGTLWSYVYSYNTGDLTSFDFLFTSDTHIGASGSPDTDAIGWMDTLAKAIAKYPKASLLLSSGDQADKGTDYQFNKFFESSVLRSLPIAAMGGSNHDDIANFKYHFNLPNPSAYGVSTSGSDYYFTYGDALFMVLNTNNHSSDTHITFMRETVAANPNYKWKFVMFHHSIYSACTHSTSPYIIDFRNKLSPELTSLDIDAVFMGHDHGYVRSYIMQGTTPQATQAVDQDGRIVNATGVQYITANSSSGSKYYDLVDPVQPWAQVRSQLYKPSFTGVRIKGNTLTIDTYRTDTMELIDSVTLCKEDALQVENASIILSSDKSILPISGGEIQLTLASKQGTGIDLSNAVVAYETTEDGTLEIDQNGKVTLKNIPQSNKEFRIWAKATLGNQTFISNAVVVQVKNILPNFTVLADQLTFVGKKDGIENMIPKDVQTLPSMDLLTVNVPVVKNQPTDKNLAVIAALYNRENTLVTTTISLMNDVDSLMDIGTEYPVIIKSNIPAGLLAEDLYVKVFFWSDIDGLIPIQDKVTLAK
ncbi:MAG: leucine-rich repeat protein [Eubacteriales bacterium]|nr:leucine-rich repeat protein [Eubacteriales bacterium]